MYETRMHLRGLTKSSAARLRNPVKYAEPKIVVNENRETIRVSLNFKSFDAKMRKFLGLVEYQFLLECDAS